MRTASLRRSVSLALLTENIELTRRIRERIVSEGPITFADFMELALYHPELGYYNSTRRPVGRAGDYLTSPEVSSLFGRLLAKHVLATWKTAGEPGSWQLVELGGGSGRMAADILDGLAETAPDLLAALSYTLVEISEPLRAEQALNLRRHADHVRWLESIDQLEPGIDGHVLSNEYFDALPFHRVQMIGGELMEIRVGLGLDDSFIDAPAEPGAPLVAYFEKLGLTLGEGCLGEVNLNAPTHMAELASRVSRGVITTLDYGYEAAQLYAPWRKQGTMLCFYQHAVQDDPYRRVGRQDITAHVDFTSLSAAARSRGWHAAALQSQMEFLSGLGAAEQDSMDGSLEERMARRRARQTLLDPAGLGRVRALRLEKGLGDSPS